MTKLMALVAFLGGCSLYTTGDDAVELDAGPVDVDAAPQTIAGAYRASFTCTSSDCVSPLATMDQASIYVGDFVDVAWSRNGDPGPSFRHAGALIAGCAAFASGFDGSLERRPYSLCVNHASPAPALEAMMTWGASTWRADLTRL